METVPEHAVMERPVAGYERPCSRASSKMGA